jgi:hypothetical protein
MHGNLQLGIREASSGSMSSTLPAIPSARIARSNEVSLDELSSRRSDTDTVSAIHE